MRTRMAAAVALAAMFVLVLVPVSETSADYSDISGETVIEAGEDADYTIVYSNHDYDDYSDVSISITYTATLRDSNGNTVSDGVDPSSGSLENGASETLTVTAPDETGTYTLTVVYTAEITYVDETEAPEEDTDEEAEESDGTVTVEVERTDSYTIKVVEGITLSVTLSSESNVDLTGIGVYFYIDGERIEDSYTTVDLEGSGSTTVSYTWVADVGEGSHTFYVLTADNGQMFGISGLGEEFTFYIGDSDYTLWIALLVIIVIILIIIMIWVYRKPIKNYGKPKSRR